MNKLLISFIFLVLTVSVQAEDGFLEFGSQNFTQEKAKTSKWSFKTGAEYIGYKTNLPEFRGVHDSIRGGEIADVLGLGISFGRDFYLGAGFNASIGIGGTYAKTLARELSNAASDLDVEIANTRKSHLILTGELQGSLGYTFDNKVIDIQPFIEGSIGLGRAELDYQYNREDIESDGTSDETYKVNSEEVFTLTKLSLGVNFISFKGLVTYVKVTTAMLTINERKVDGRSNIAGTADIVDLDTPKQKKLDEVSFVTMASLGLGYLF